MTDQVQQQANELIEQNQAEPTPEASPERVTEGTPEVDPKQWASEFFGAKPEEVKSFWEKRQEMQQKLQDLEAKSKVSPYSSPVVGHINQMIADGKKLEDVSRFLQVQTADFSTIDNETIVKQRLKDERPDFSQEEIDELFKIEYPEVRPDEEGNISESEITRRKVRIKDAARKARDYFQSQKVDLDSLTKQRQMNADETKQKIAETQEAWGEVVDKLVLPQVQKMPIEIESKDFTYKIEVPIDEATLKQVRDLVTSQNLGNIPLNEQGLKQVRRIASDIAKVKSFDRFAETIARDAFAKGRKSALDEASGQQPVAPVRGKPPVVEPGKAPKGFV